MRVFLGLLVFAVLSVSVCAQAQNGKAWRVTSEDELKSVIPARAPVVAEHIETEFRTASGITDGRGRFVAGVVLITAGYSAEGKYSHYLLTQVRMKLGNLSLPAGQYVFGWTRKDETLRVHFYDAATGRELGQTEAVLNPVNQPGRVIPNLASVGQGRHPTRQIHLRLHTSRMNGHSV